LTNVGQGVILFSEEKGTQMMYESFAHEQLVRLAEGALSDSELAQAFTAISKDEHIKRLSGMYLVGSYERSAKNLENLNTALAVKFLGAEVN
jgi:hypothetical protein